MAKKSFSERVPEFKWIFLFALIVSVPVTLWSLNSAPTETRSHAATYTCGPNGVNPSCPVNYHCSYIQGNPTFGGNCLINPLLAPTSLTQTYSSCIKYDLTFGANVKFSWSAVSGATGYRVKFHSYDTYNKVDTTMFSNTTTNTYKTYNGYSYPRGYTYYWTVQAYNSSYSSSVVRKNITFSCNTL